MTGARVKRVERYLGDADLFLCTYGDGLADVDVAALVAFHRSHGRLATVTGVHPPSRFGELVARRRRGRATSPRSPPRRRPGSTAASSSSIAAFSTGSRRTRPACSSASRWRARRATASCACYRHDGFWQCADTLRDVELLRSLWSKGGAPWRIWDDRSGAAPIPGDRRGAVHAVPEAALAPRDG